MRKSSSLIVALSLVASIALVGCGSNSNNANKKENGASNKVTTNEKANNAKTENKEEAKKTEFKYYTADELKEAIEKKADLLILDIQVEDEYKAHHIKGAIPTYAYPVKTDEEKAKLDSSLEKINSSKAPVVIVCPGGAGGAERTYEYLKGKNVDESRLFILEKGQKAWPHEDLLEK
ncbi:rhodanese-like domain-containing protein [Clostridium ihumii]|uniref:rhodanese-like domain-containing protein n=1 Tax=Clostridium ihumii TaxID=1470356 RepID=UPI00058EBAB5|nr:rhodanese-like domain-containing protein [Clostridium ihumii]